MNKTEFITFLHNPNRLSTEQLEELEVLVNEHPSFLSARLLLAKASKDQKDFKTNKRIASAAIYSTDRILFQKYLNGNFRPLSAPKKVEEVSIELKKEDPLVKKESERADKRPSALSPREEKELPQVPELPSGDLDSILEELQRDMEELKLSRVKFSEIQKKIEEEKISKSSKKALNTEEDHVEKQQINELKQEFEQQKSYVEEDENQSPSEVTRQILEATRKVKEEVSIEEAQDKLEKSSKSDEKINAIQEENKNDGEKNLHSQQNIIINNFIKKSPTIKYQRTENVNIEDLANESAARDPNLISEYLAEIHLRQGNKNRAIEIYESLSLKYPEKKSYFARLISNIE